GVTPPGGDPALSIRSTLFWNAQVQGSVDHIAFPETGDTAPNKDNDGGFDEAAWIKTGSLSNLWDTDPGITPFDRANPVFGPAASLAEGAQTPPNDGFFDTTASYIGAFRDANDTWASSGNW